MKIGPREVATGVVFSVLVLFVILLITSKDDKCCPSCISPFQSCQASIDIPVLPDYAYQHPSKQDEYHPIPEPSSFALFGIGGGVLIASKLRASKQS